jgi:hypothetical protein
MIEEITVNYRPAKREQFALGAILSKKDMADLYAFGPEGTVQIAVAYADALLKELDNEQKPS